MDIERASNIYLTGTGTWTLYVIRNMNINRESNKDKNKERNRDTMKNIT